MADEKLIQSDKIAEYVTDKIHGDKLKDPSQIAKLVMSAFSNVENNGFLPVGDFTTPKGKQLIKEWNESLKNLFDQLSNPSQSMLNPNISYQSLLEADAKGTEIKRYLDPTPLKNRLNQTYEEARSDEFPMNVVHMDYTNDLGDYTKSREFQEVLHVYSLLDFNGDGVFDGISEDGYKGDAAAILILYNNYRAGELNKPLYRFVTSINKENANGTTTTVEGKELRDYLIDCLNGGTSEHFSYEGINRIDYLFECMNEEGEAGYFIYNTDEKPSNSTTDIIPLVISPNGPYKTTYQKIAEVTGINKEEKEKKIYEIISKIASETVGERHDKIDEYNKKISCTNVDTTYSSYIITTINNNGTNKNYVRYRDVAQQFFDSDEFRAIRLLMPQYARRVEVEDLNKNFWVIGQVLDALAQGLLGPNGIYSSAEKMCEELSQLWQNTAFLWNLVAELANKRNDYYDDDIDQLKKQIELLKKALGFGEVDDVSWSILDLTAPHISMGQNARLDTFKIHCGNQFGSREIDNIISTSRVRPTTSFHEAPVHFSINGSNCDGAYDMRGTIENMNKYFVNSKANNKVDLSYLTISNDKKHTQADFLYARVPAFVSDEEKEKIYNKEKCLSVFLNESESDVFFRVIPNFSIVCYDRDYYKVDFEDKTVNLIVDADGGTENTIPITRSVAKISCSYATRENVESKINVLKQNIEKYEASLPEFKHRQVGLELLLEQNSSSDNASLIKGLKDALKECETKIEDIENKISDAKEQIRLFELASTQKYEEQNLEMFQDSPDKIIIYLPHDKCYEGDIFKIDFKDFYLQDCVPKTTSGQENSIDSAELIKMSESGDYWNNSEYKFWRSTFDRVHDGEPQTIEKQTETEDQIITDKLTVSRPTFSVNNKIFITYRNSSMNIGKTLENEKTYINASLLRTDIVGPAEGYDVGITTETTESKNGISFTVPRTKYQYQDYERCLSNYTIYSLPGVIQDGVSPANNSKGLVVNNLIANIPYPSCVSESATGKILTSILDNDAFNSTITELVGAEKENLYPIFGVSNALLTKSMAQNTYYYPNTLFYFHAITYPHVYDFAITSIMCSTEAQNVSYRGNQISKIKLYGARENKNTKTTWSESKQLTDYWRIQPDKIVGEVGNRDVIVDFVTDAEYYWKTGHHYYGFYDSSASYYFTPKTATNDYFVAHRMAMAVESRNGEAETIGGQPISNAFASSQLRSKEIYIGAIMQQPTVRRSTNSKYIDTTICMPYIYTTDTPEKDIVSDFIEKEYTAQGGIEGNRTQVDKENDSNWYADSHAYSSFEALSGQAYGFSESMPYRDALEYIQFDKCPDNAKKINSNGEMYAIIMVKLNTEKNGDKFYLMSTRCGSHIDFPDREHIACADGDYHNPTRTTYKFITRENFRTICEKDFFSFTPYTIQGKTNSHVVTKEDIAKIFGSQYTLGISD